MNVCGPCGLDFAGIEDFDAHRVGTHAYTITEGLRMTPPREDGRRCLGVSEMLEAGWGLNNRERWLTPGRLRRQARAGAIFAPSRIAPRKESPAHV